MAVSDNPLQRAPISVVARDTGAAYSAGNSNGLLELGSALAKLEPTVNTSLQTYAAYQSQSEAVQARKDAITTSGAKLADAVREGTIKPTQNPWYIQAYNRESAAVSARTQLSALQLDAASWSEKNDPAAFSARWNKEVGAIGEQYSGVDQNTGFNAVAAQVSQQTLASNQAQNVQRIETERVQNSSALLAGDLSAAMLANGGTLTGDKALPAVAAARANWIGTGGSPEAWNKLLASAVTSAAYNTKNSGLMDLLKDPSLSGDGKTPVYNMAGVADAAEKDRYDIDRAADYQAQSRIRVQQQALLLKGQQGLTDLYAQFGNDITKGNVSSSQMIDALVQKGYSPQEAAAGVAAVGKTLSGVAEADTARLSINGNDPAEAAEILDLQGEAIKNGYTAEWAARVKAKVLSGQLKESSAQTLLSTAQSRSDHFDSENRADARQAASDERRRLADQDSRDVKALRDVHQTALNIGARAARNVTVINKRGTYAPLPMVKTVQGVSVAAAQGWLAVHQGDYAGAKQAAFDAAEAWGHGQLRHSTGTSGARR